MVRVPVPPGFADPVHEITARHHRAWARKRSGRQIFFGGLLVSDRTACGVSGDAISRSASASSSLAAYTDSSHLVLPDVAHELRLQLLRAEFTADVKGAFAICDLIIPRTEIKHRLVEVDSGGPHQPPAVVSPLEHAAVGSGATIKGIGNRILEISELHLGDCSCKR